MSTLSARATERRHHRTAARIVGTVGVLGVAAAVAGMATFGNFTYTSGPIDTQVQGGVLSIDLAHAGDGLTMPFGGGLFLPGDSRGWRVDLVNNGDTALSSVSLTSRVTSSSILDTDTTHGLQLDVKSCSAAWTVNNGVYSCAGTQKAFYSGPIVVAGPVQGVDRVRAAEARDLVGATPADQEVVGPRRQRGRRSSSAR